MAEVSTRKLVYDFRRKYNSVNSGKNRDLPLVDVIAFLNEGYQRWFKNQLRLEDQNQEVKDNLRPFLISRVKLECEAVDDQCCKIKYPEGLYRRRNQLAITTKEDCCPGITKEIIIRIVESDDLHEARRNPLRKSDFYFEQLIAVEERDGLLVYHDGAMDISYVYIDYYRMPKELHAPSLEECAPGYYYDYDGRIITQDQNFEAGNTFASNDVVDFAILFANRDTMDYNAFQAQLTKMSQSPLLGIDR